jgi:predicted dehydrogenase
MDWPILSIKNTEETRLNSSEIRQDFQRVNCSKNSIQRSHNNGLEQVLKTCITPLSLIEPGRVIDYKRMFIMKNKIRWGFIGAGFIAHQFAKGLKVLQDQAEIVAVCDAIKHKADDFAKEFDVAKSYGSLEELLNNADVDVVYVATQNTFHKECVISSLKAGKAVLCEKPLGVNSIEEKEMIDVARKSGRFLMEACWMRFQPAMVKVHKWITEGMIGEPRMINVEFGFRAVMDPNARLFNLDLIGGAIMDVGIYGMSFPSMYFGHTPKFISAFAHIGETGVDEQTAVILKHDKGQLTTLKFACRTDTPQTAKIFGTDGYIEIPMFWRSTEASLTRTAGGSLYQPVTGKEHIEMPYMATGYEYEAMEVMKCLREGKKESNIMPLDESLAIMKVMDEVRKQIGLKFPVEK